MKHVCAYIHICDVDSIVPLQSIKSVAHRPLSYWAIRAAILSPSISKIYVVADSEHIQRVLTDSLRKLNPEKLIFTKNSKNLDNNALFIDFCRENTESEYICWISPYSLLLKPEQLEQAIALIKADNTDSVIGVTEQSGEQMKVVSDGLLQKTEGEKFLQDANAFSVSLRNGILKNSSRIFGRIGYIKLTDFIPNLNNNSDWMAAEYNLLAHHPEVAPRKDAKLIKMVIVGVDGVLTDNSVYYNTGGEEVKRFSNYDSVAFSLLNKRGYKTAIIDSQNNPSVKKYAEKLGVDYILQDVGDKLVAAQGICTKEGIEFSNVAFIGDDINDIELLKVSGISACPNNAVNAVKSIYGIIHLTALGGSGALRSFLKYIFGEVIPEEVTISRNHLQVHRPWGAFEVLCDYNGYKSKRICVRSGGKLSLQMHHHRKEHWIIVQGIAYVTLGDVEKEYAVGEHIYIPVGVIHRLENRGSIPLDVLEVSLGSYLEEDDIVRLEDIYGRA